MASWRIAYKVITSAVGMKCADDLAADGITAEVDGEIVEESLTEY